MSRKTQKLAPVVALTVGRLLAGYRMEKRISQREAGAKIWMNGKSISTFETGYRTDSMRFVALWKMLTVYGVSLAQFERDLTHELADLRRAENGAKA